MSKVEKPVERIPPPASRPARKKILAVLRLARYIVNANRLRRKLQALLGGRKPRPRQD